MAGAQETFRWQIDNQHVILDIGGSGQVSMQYNVSAVIVKGVWNEVWIPATTSNLQVSSVVDGSGNPHSFSLSDGQIKVQGFNLKPGDHVTLVINSQLPGFVFQSDRPGYDIVSFTPPWWDMTISDNTVTYALPAVINHSEVFTGPRDYSNIFEDQGRTVVMFNGKNMGSNQQFDTAVIFPDRYMAAGAVASKGPAPVVPGTVSGSPFDLPGSLFSLLFCGIWIIVPALIIMSIIMGFGRKPYTSPLVSMDGVGVNKNLDPAEAAMLLRMDPRRILTLIMFELMKAGNVKLISTDPVRLEIASRKDLNYYEKPFMDAIKADGSLDEDGLLKSFKILAQRVVDKTRPYCRKDTEEYYRQKINESWDAVKAMDTPELKLQKYDTNMIWLMADEDFTKKTKDNLRSPGWDTYNVPNYYWWYPYYFGFPSHYGYGTPSTGQPQPQQPQQPSPQAPSGGGTPTNQTTATVESFANKVSNSVESVSAGVVGGIESFLGVRNAANAPPPAPITPSHMYTPSSSCACVSCACACVSCACACACAGGGGGCT